MTSPEELNRRIKALRDVTEEKPVKRKQPQHGLAVQIAAELIAGVGCGFFAGYYLDEWLGTSPLFLILCLIFGTGAAFVTVQRVNQAYIKNLEKSDEETK